MAEGDFGQLMAEFMELVGLSNAPGNRTQVPTDQQFQYRDTAHIMHHVRGQFGNWLGDLFERSNVATVLLGPAGPGDSLTVVAECDHNTDTVTATVKHGDRVVARLTFELVPDREY